MRYREIKKTMAGIILSAVILSAFPGGTAAAAEEKLSSGYIYFGKPASYLSMVDKTGGALNQISPSYFDLNTDGSLKLNGSIDTNLIANMQQEAIRVVPFLSNHWNRQTGINALQNRAALSQQIADAVKTYKLDGVEVDLENLTEAERSMYVDFMRLLREKLPAGSILSVAVAANPWGIDKGWQGSYDYTGLAQYCDRLTLMAYDEHYEGSAEGPVAGAEFVEKSIQYALKKVPADKIVLGIPFYGRYWKQGSSYGGYGISAVTVESLISKYNGTVTMDTQSHSPKAVITIKAGDTKPVILGSALEAGTYSIWYENEESIKYKLRMVQKYGLKGTANWSLGQEASGTWDYYGLWLEGRYFSDIDGHWAQEAIYTAEQNGWMLGTTSTLFQPEAPLTRAQAAAVLVRMLGLETTAQQSSFADAKNHWAWKEIEAAYEAGIIQGTGGDNFEPNASMTREQMAVMLDRLFTGLETPAELENVFTDISRETNSWSYDSILKMSHYGIVQGYTASSFRPQSTLTRAQMAALMQRISEKAANGVVVAVKGSLT